MKTKLTDPEKDELLPKLQEAIATGTRWEDENLHLPAGAIIEAVLEIPGMRKDKSNPEDREGWSQNGWEWDWWQDFKHKGKRYTLSGSGYYGGHAFGLADEQ